MEPQEVQVQQPTPSHSFVSKLLIIVGLVVFAGVCGFGGYMLSQKQIALPLVNSIMPNNQTTPTPPTTQTQTNVQTTSYSFKKTDGYQKFVVGNVEDPAQGLKYVSYQDGYTFNYPKNWDVFVDQLGKLVIVTSVDNAKTLRETLYAGADGACHPLGPISVQLLTQQQFDEQFGKTDPNAKVTQEQTTVDGVPATQYVFTYNFDPCGSSSDPDKSQSTDVVIKLKDKIYELSLSDSIDPEKQVLFSKFLSTFRFLDK